MTGPPEATVATPLTDRRLIAAELAGAWPETIPDTTDGGYTGRVAIYAALAREGYEGNETTMIVTFDQAKHIWHRLGAALDVIEHQGGSPP